MPIEFDEKTLRRVNDKTGMYSSLRKVNKVMQESDKATTFIMDLRAQLLKTIEVAFREYAKEHKGCTLRIENEAWRRFQKRLKKYL